MEHSELFDLPEDELTKLMMLKKLIESKDLGLHNHSLQKNAQELRSRDWFDESMYLPFKPDEPLMEYEDSYSGNMRSKFNPKFIFTYGLDTNNMVLSFFVSNPGKNNLYSKEDVFAHLNKHDDNLGISDYFTVCESKYDDKRESTIEVSAPIGRISTGKSIDHLVSIGAILKDAIGDEFTCKACGERIDDNGEGHKQDPKPCNNNGEKVEVRYKYRLNEEHPSAEMMMRTLSSWETNKVFLEFEKQKSERIRFRKWKYKDNILDNTSLDKLITSYLEMLVGLEEDELADSSVLAGIPNKITVLLTFCESNNKNWSTMNREWNKIMKRELCKRSDAELKNLCEYLKPWGKQPKEDSRENFFAIFDKVTAGALEQYPNDENMQKRHRSGILMKRKEISKMMKYF